MEDAGPLPTATSWKLRWGSYLLVASGLIFVIQGAMMVYRAVSDTVFEPGVTDLGGVTAAELSRTNPALLSYIDHLAVNVGGLLVVVGIAMVAIVWYGVRSGQGWALATTIALPVVYLLFSVPIHRVAQFHFDEVLHLGPVGIGLPLFAAGAALAVQGLRTVGGPS